MDFLSKANIPARIQIKGKVEIKNLEFNYMN